jgi:uncharacterized protein YgiM (DUF1202 family)
MTKLQLKQFGLLSLAAGLLTFGSPGTAQVPSGICAHSFRVVSTNDGSRLNLRSSPSDGANSQIIGSIPNGTEVLANLSDRSGNWEEITLADGSRGWVAARFLRRSPIGSTQFNGSMRVRTLSGDSVALRSAPDPQARIITRLNNNAIVFFKQSEGYWNQVTTQTGQTGYVDNSYLICE